MACRPAPACAKALKEATERSPNRDRASDGICASAQHSKLNRTSDHEPDADGEATAFDIDHDPDGGFDCAYWAEQLRERRDPRVKYVIYRGRMFASYERPHRKAWTWAPYTGPNPHVKHMHVSLLPAFKRSTADWWIAEKEDDVPQPTDKVDALITPTGDGVWVLQRDGGIITHGNAPFYGAYPGLPEKDRQGDRYFVAIHPYKGGYLAISDRGEPYHFPAK